MNLNRLYSSSEVYVDQLADTYAVNAPGSVKNVRGANTGKNDSIQYQFGFDVAPVPGGITQYSNLIAYRFNRPNVNISYSMGQYSLEEGAGDLSSVFNFIGVIPTKILQDTGLAIGSQAFFDLLSKYAIYSSRDLNVILPFQYLFSFSPNNFTFFHFLRTVMIVPTTLIRVNTSGILSFT